MDLYNTNIKLLLIRELKIFYLSLEDLENLFQNNLYICHIYNKKFRIYLFVRYFYQIKIIN